MEMNKLWSTFDTIPEPHFIVAFAPWFFDENYYKHRLYKSGLEPFDDSLNQLSYKTKYITKYVKTREVGSCRHKRFKCSCNIRSARNENLIRQGSFQEIF